MAKDPALKAKQQEAEAAKLVAEAKKIEAETRKAEAEAREAEIGLEKAELALVHAREQDAYKRAADEYQHIYRFDGQVSGPTVEACIQTLTAWSRVHPGCDIEVIFFSPGGGIIPGMALFDFLRELSAAGHKVITGCTGYAASMAGILVQAGDHRWASEQSWYMIHRAAFGAAGKTFEVEDEVEFVKRIEKRIIDIFVKRSTLTPAKIKRNWDRKDWWIDAEEALEIGLIDEIRGSLVRVEPDAE